ncbi:MAG: hypothetical protein ACOCNL_17310, partial [Acetivibrio ethanolgignens]
MNRKKQLLSLILSFCMIVTSAAVGGKEVYAAEYDAVSMTEETENVFQPYFKVGDKKKFNDQDIIKFGSDGKIVEEGVSTPNSNQYFSMPTGEWIVSETDKDSDLSIVKAEAEPKVYVQTTGTGDFTELTLGEAESNGMASATLPTDSAVSDAVKEFYGGLDIKVSKTVDKLEPGSLKLDIKDKSGNKVMHGYFKVYQDAEKKNPWYSDDTNPNNYINSQSKALGGILSKDVTLYLVPDTAVMKVKALVKEGKGSISPTDLYINTFDNTAQTYTVTTADRFSVEKVTVNKLGDSKEKLEKIIEKAKELK